MPENTTPVMIIRDSEHGVMYPPGFLYNNQTPHVVQNTHGAMNRIWSTGVCECCSDEETCWWGLWSCWLVSARTVKSFDIQSSLGEIGYFWGFIIVLVLSFVLFKIIGLLVFGIVLGAIYAWHRANARSEIRNKLSIYGSWSDDLCLHCFLPCCAVCQEAREAKFANAPHVDFCSGDLLSEQEDLYERMISASSRSVTLSTINAMSTGTNASVSRAVGGSCTEHFGTISRTSKIILVLWGSLCTLTMILLFVFRQGLSFAMLLLIFVQPFLILYFVYWRSRRQYANLDYVIKIFAVGFWFAPFQSIVAESIIQFCIGLIMLPFIGKTQTMPSDDNPGDDADTEHSREVLRKNLGVVIFGLFLMAFVCAAGVEETAKHFTVRCCRFANALSHPHTILVYLVAGALGFATAENIEYVFSAAASANGHHIGKLQVFENELVVLVTRILTPIHVICSVLQASNLARVLCLEESMSLFSMLFPAVLLHGWFDFSLFTLGVLAFVYPSNAQTCIVLTLVLVLLFTIGGVIAAVLMFNKTLAAFDSRQGLIRSSTEGGSSERGYSLTQYDRGESIGSYAPINMRYAEPTQSAIH